MENKPSKMENLNIPESQEKLPDDPRKPYTAPRVIHELELEIRAGSPIPGFEPWDFDLP